jgi:colanic acid/amylovoran biosynthesis glycosyltransferase
VRLAYLCNLYPAVSHSFVRREIESVEQLGHEVHRFSLRPARSDLKDDADLREVQLTETVLRQGAFRLILAALTLSIIRPIRTVRAMGAAWRLSGPGLKMKFRHIAYWLEAAWLVRRTEQLRIEHLHCHFGTNPAAVAVIARAWGGPPFSFTVHGPDEFDAPITLSLGKKIEASAFVVAITSYCRSQLMRWSPPGQWHKIKVIRCGLDDSILGVDAGPVSADSIAFVCIARLSAQKGLPLLIAACAKLRDSGEPFSVAIIGGGELQAVIEQEIERHNLAGVVNLAGICSTPDMHEHIRRARAFVLPSFAEGLPMTIMEAFAFARPVVTTAIAGIPELVDEECGWVVPAGSEEALVEAMKAALHASAADLTAKGKIGRERVRELHNGAKNAAQIVEAAAQASAITSTR